MLNIIKRITADYGDAVLADPKRLKAFLGDLAKDEPKPLRTAFVCCIEAGAYNALKTVRNAGERAEHKEMLARRVRDEQGLDRTLCAEALDILEAALFAVTPEKPVCAKCGKELQAGWKACPFCGAAVEVRKASAVAGAEEQKALTAAQKQNIAFFPPLYDELKKMGFEPTKVQSNHSYLSVSIGKNKFMGFWYFHREHSFKIYFFSHNFPHWGKLEKAKSAIEEAVKERLSPIEDRGNGWARIAISRQADELTADLRTWALQKMVLFHKAIVKVLES